MRPNFLLPCLVLPLLTSAISILRPANASALSSSAPTNTSTGLNSTTLINSSDPTNPGLLPNSTTLTNSSAQNSSGLFTARLGQPNFAPVGIVTLIPLNPSFSVTELYINASYTNDSSVPSYLHFYINDNSSTIPTGFCNGTFQRNIESEPIQCGPPTYQFRVLFANPIDWAIVMYHLVDVPSGNGSEIYLLEGVASNLPTNESFALSQQACQSGGNPCEWTSTVFVAPSLMVNSNLVPNLTGDPTISLKHPKV
ncbi:MAG: hypothetical protein M1824_003558 [Vezdaea acicularis]|nr:MAG: hypothetical protein M1824_003558 [Vezdaea acicularis]